MTPDPLLDYLKEEISAFPGKTALLAAIPSRDEPLLAVNIDRPFPAASTIKTSILLAALEQVRQGLLTLDDVLTVDPSVILEDTEVFDRGETRYTLWELLYWMIVRSDNTATNVILDYIGFDTVNEYCTQILGLKHTVCQRKMLDLKAARAGLDNFTSAADQRQMYCMLQNGQLLNPSLRSTALSILTRQRDYGGILRYIPDDVTVAHKSGGLDGVAHDSGILLLPNTPLYLGLFTWEGPSPDGDPTQRKYIGRMAKAIFDAYKKEL